MGQEGSDTNDSDGFFSGYDSARVSQGPSWFSEDRVVLGGEAVIFASDVLFM